MRLNLTDLKHVLWRSNRTDKIYYQQFGKYKLYTKDHTFLNGRWESFGKGKTSTPETGSFKQKVSRVIGVPQIEAQDGQELLNLLRVLKVRSFQKQVMFINFPMMRKTDVWITWELSSEFILKRWMTTSGVGLGKDNSENKSMEEAVAQINSCDG